MVPLGSGQFSGLNAITPARHPARQPGTAGGRAEQQIELEPTQIMSNTGTYSDVVLGLFRLLGYHYKGIALLG